jgi:hypothetical protein
MAAITPPEDDVYYPESDSAMRRFLEERLDQETAARLAAEERVRALEEELARLRRERS